MSDAALYHVIRWSVINSGPLTQPSHKFLTIGRE